MTLADGTQLSPALGIGAFVEKTLVAAGQCTKVDPAVPPEVAGLLGCGVMAGLGAALNTGSVTPRRLGRGHRLRRGRRRGGARRRAGRRAARSSRSTSTTGSWSGPSSSAPPTRSTPASSDPVEGIRELTGGNGADVVIEAIGRPETYEQAFYARDLAGTVVLVGVPTPDMRLELPLLDFFGRGGALKSSWYGDCLPERDFPMLIDLYLQGRLPLDKFVSETIALDEVEEAFAKMERGEVLRGRGDALIPGGPAGQSVTRIAMWSGPRTVSTALMRAFENRPDTVVADEPLYAFYLARTGIDHPGRDGDSYQPAKRLAGRARRRSPTGRCRAGRTISYAKHMTHHLLPEVDRRLLAPLRHAT